MLETEALHFVYSCWQDRWHDDGHAEFTTAMSDARSNM